MSGHFVDIPRGRAYAANPEAGKGPGLLIFPDVAADDRDLGELDDPYAYEGYVVLCPEVSASSGALRTLSPPSQL